MDFGDLLKSCAKETNETLEKFLPKKIGRDWVEKAVGNGDYDTDAVNGFLEKPLWDFLGRGGKRWRPLLMFLACEAVGGNPGKIREFAVIPELLHNGSIIIDDVEDGSLTRRGKPALNIGYGVDVAVNLGNLLYFLPLLVIKNSGLGSEKKAKVYGLIIDDMVKLHFGQGTDIYWHKTVKGKVSEQQYFAMCANKTGGLARMSAKLGAVLGNGDEKQVEALGNFAESIGIAFQIQDDILNLKGGLGKEFGEDITEAKMSMPVIRTLAAATGADKNKLLRILKKHSSDANEIKEAIALIEKYRGMEYSAEVAKKLIRGSWEKLDKMLADSKAKDKLRQLADFMVERKF